MSTTAKSMAQLMESAYVEGTNLLMDRSRGVVSTKVTDGMKPSKAPAREGLYVFSPEELLSLMVNPVAVNGNVVGYQRDLDLKHARKIAVALRGEKPMPLIHIALDGHGRMWIVDGQHRAAAGIIARASIEGVVQHMDKDAQASLFFSQRNAKVVDRNVLVLAGHGPFDRYVQEAVSTTGHPWHPVVSASRKSATKVSPYAMYQLLIRYIGNVEGQAAGHRTSFDDRWDRGYADELAPLISCFGNKQTNPLAFRPTTLQAIGAAALWVLRRHASLPDDHERWRKHMPLFPFESFLHVRTQRQMTGVLLDHWNKRLSASRRVSR